MVYAVKGVQSALGVLKMERVLPDTAMRGELGGGGRI